MGRWVDVRWWIRLDGWVEGEWWIGWDGWGVKRVERDG